MLAVYRYVRDFDLSVVGIYRDFDKVSILAGYCGFGSQKRFA